MPGYISEYKAYGYSDTEFIEIALPEGTDPAGYVLVRYDGSGHAVEKYSLGPVQNTMAGHDVYVIDHNTHGFDAMDGQGEIEIDSGLALVDSDGNVVQFISHHGNTITAQDGPAAKMTSTDVGSIGKPGQSLQSDDGGKSYYRQSDNNAGSIPACYATGTLIGTSDGPRAVEALQPGDWIDTLGSHPQRIRWIWQGDQALDSIDGGKTPVLIKAGSLGRGRPLRDLIVSPQHRMLAGAPGQMEQIFDCEVLVPAKALTGLRGVRHMRGKRAVRWHHFACDGHFAVQAEGCWSESLLLGPVIVGGLNRHQRNAVGRLFPARSGRDWLNGPPARPCLTVRQTKEALAHALLAG